MIQSARVVVRSDGTVLIWTAVLEPDGDPVRVYDARVWQGAFAEGQAAGRLAVRTVRFLIVEVEQ